MDTTAIAEHVEQLIRWLNRQRDSWMRIERRDSGHLTDAEVKSYMRGHAMWDDPPEGWTEKELLLWSRGYLWGESTHLGNAAETLRAAMDLDFGLKAIAKALKTSK